MKKAVLSNRIIMTATPALKQKIDDRLTYTIPGFNDQPLVLRTMKIVRDGLISIPIGRTDLIPDDYEIVEKRVLAPTDFPKFNGELRESQRAVYDALDDNAIINAKVSWGKAQPHHSKIRVPNGWSTMGDIKIGDTVITPNGDLSTVIGKYLHRNKPIYKFTFLDGRTAEACEDHLWCVFPKDKKTTKLLTTKQLFDTSTHNKYHIPLVECINDSEKPHIIHPYLLGYLLGDGGLTNATVFSTADEEVVEKLSSMLPENHTIKHRGNYDYAISSPLGQENLVLNELRRLGIMGKLSHDKFIPDEYKYDSLDNRLDLLCGLLDSDGSIETSGKIEFCSTSQPLINDFQELIQSLGGTFNMSSRVTQYTYKGEKKDGRVSYRGRPTRISYELKQRLFSIPRKLSRVAKGKLDDVSKLGISKIEYIGDMDCSCIEIDHDSHLYITDNYVVTHNTFTGLAIAGKLGQKTLIITHTIPLRSQWAKECKKVYGFDPGLIGGSSYDDSKPITVGNVQTLYNRPDIARKFGTIILDEMHHVSSPTFGKIIDTSCARYKIGLSGTIERKDGRHVVFTDYFSSNIYRPPRENSMTPEIHRVMVDVTLPDSHRLPWALKINNLMGDINYQNTIAAISASYAAQGHTVLVLSDRVSFLEIVANLVGPTAACLIGKTKDRDAVLAKVGTEYSVLCGTQSIFSEGISHNPISCIVLATPINNEPLLEQIIGRAVRELQGKKQPVIVDINLKGRTAEKQAMNRLGHYIKQEYGVKQIWI